MAYNEKKIDLKKSINIEDNTAPTTENNIWNRQLTYIALQAPGTWYFKCNLDNQYLACVFELSASKDNSKFSFAV